MPVPRILIFLVPAAPLLGCSSVNTALLYSNYETGQYDQTDFWCGNRPRGGSNAVCTSKATNASGEMSTRAIEVRGWVIAPPGYNEKENEFIFHLRLDHGWTPASPADQHADPINTVEKINQVITPHNMVAFGRGPSMETTAWLGDNTWGSQNALTIHVEINGWGSRSLTQPHRARSWPPPDGWIISSGSGPEGAAPGVAWSFDPWNPPSVPSGSGALASGDYVRMVGLLWEDAPHEDSDEGRSGQDGSRTKDGKQCWKHGRHDRGAVGRGFSELHPVDYAARIEPVVRDDVIFAIAMCDNASTRRKIRPPIPQPSPTARLDFEEYIDNEFTNLGSVTRKRVNVHADFVEVDLITRNRTNGTRGKFKAIYRVFWTE